MEEDYYPIKTKDGKYRVGGIKNKMPKANINFRLFILEEKVK
ncbi:MAG: hypothetical protein U9Q73_02520 [Nanoarchaeota archaeon]|nr:hypothetical protein [Nanoarchaeota archaeon]